MIPQNGCSETQPRSLLVRSQTRRKADAKSGCISIRREAKSIEPRLYDLFEMFITKRNMRGYSRA